MPDDPMDLRIALERGTLDDVLREMKPDDPVTWRSGDRTALSLALGNRSPVNRLQIAHMLLDRGADAGFVLEQDSVGALHILFSHEPHEYEAEALLATRLIERGADPNLVSPRFGSPLATLAATFKFTDETLQPFYTALIESGKLNLATIDKGGRTMLENVAVKVKRRRSLYDQLLELQARTNR